VVVVLEKPHERIVSIFGVELRHERQPLVLLGVTLELDLDRNSWEAFVYVIRELLLAVLELGIELDEEISLLELELLVCG